VIHVGAIMPRHVKEQMIAWWGPILTDVYGSSELGTISRITASEWLERPGSVGRPVPWFSVQIIGEDDEELPPGEVGTIYLSALNDADLMYLDDPVKTAEAHRGPKQFTLNDLGRVDQDGYLYLADRRDDLIISGGVNIYPAEVEEVLIEHPAVDDVAVFAVPDPEWGHAVKAAVSLRAGWDATSSTEAAIKEWARTRMAHLKVPHSIDFHHEVPRFANGKLRRRALREAYWTSSDQAIPSHDSAR
jgi:long-chain acyl-CoA synthetase